MKCETFRKKRRNRVNSTTSRRLGRHAWRNSQARRAKGFRGTSPSATWRVPAPGAQGDPLSQDAGASRSRPSDREAECSGPFRFALPVGPREGQVPRWYGQSGASSANNKRIIEGRLPLRGIFSHYHLIAAHRLTNSPHADDCRCSKAGGGYRRVASRGVGWRI